MPRSAHPRRTGATALLAALTTAFSALLVVAAPPGVADAPGNDDLADASGPLSLATGASTTFGITTAEATRESGEPTACAATTTTVWVAYTPLDTQLLTVETVAVNAMDTVLAAYTAATPGTYPLESAACNDDTTGLGRRSRITFLASEGTTYYLQVGHYSGTLQSDDPGPGPLALSLSAAAPLPNDDVTTPIQLPDDVGLAAVDTTNATRSTTDPPKPTLTGRSLWYSWTAPSDLTEENPHVRFFAGSGDQQVPDTFLFAFPATGPTTMATALAYDDDVDEDGDDYRSELVFPVTPGTTYRILAGTRADHGAFELTYSMPPAPPRPGNDRFEDATPLSGAGGTSAGDTQDATSEPQDPDLQGASGGHSVWYEWEAPADGFYRFRTQEGLAGVDTVLAVLTGTSFATLQVAVQNDDAADDVATSEVLLDAVGGTTYHVMVDGYASRPRGAFDLAWEQVFPDATTTDMVTPTSAPVAGVVDLTMSVEHTDDGDPATGTVQVRDGDTLVDTLTLDGAGTATTRLRNQTAGAHTYSATFVPAGPLELGSSDTAPVTVAARPHPANDAFAAAAVITGGTGTVSPIDLLGATAQVGDPDLDDDSDGASVWYRWTAPATGTFTFTVASTDPAVDSLVGVLRGTTLQDLTLLGSSRAPAGPGAEVTFPAIQGRTYHVVVDAVVAGGVSLAWSLTGGTATTTTLTPSSTGFYAYRLQADVTGATEGTVLFLRDGTVVGRAETTTGQAVLDLTGQRPGAASFTAEFYPDDPTVRPSESASQPLTVTAPPAPGNDPFTSATTITGQPSVTGTTSGATPDAGTPPSGLPQNADTTVWYRWVAPSSGSFLFTVTRDAAPTDTVLRAFEGSTLASLRTLAENDDANGVSPAQSVVGISAVQGRTYHLAVDSYRISTMGGFTLTWQPTATTGTTATTLSATRSGRTVTLTATVDDLGSTGTPAGFVEFFEGPAASPVSRGTVLLGSAGDQVVRTLTDVTPGAHTYRAVFVPNDYRLAQSTSPNRAVSVPKTATRTTLAAPARARAGSRPVVTATVKQGTANATGSVRFTVNNRVVATVALRSGRATYALRPVTIGLTRVVATYLGTAVLATSSATRSMTVSR